MPDDELRESLFGLALRGPFAVITSCCDAAAIEDTVRLVKLGAGHIYCTFGAHPKRALWEWDADLVTLFQDAMRRCGSQVVAWGECGLDYSGYGPLDEASGRMGEEFELERQRQQQILKENIEIAVGMGLPIQFHSRDCEADFVECLLKWLPRGHPFHWHSAIASPTVVEMILKEFPNAYFGVSGYIAFPYAEDWELLNQMSETEEANARTGPCLPGVGRFRPGPPMKNKVNLVDMVKRIPLDRILLETDAPHFTVNTGGPADVLEIASSVAVVKDLTPEEVLRANERNAKRLYGIEATKIPAGLVRETAVQKQERQPDAIFRGIRTWQKRRNYKPLPPMESGSSLSPGPKEQTRFQSALSAQTQAGEVDAPNKAMNDATKSLLSRPGAGTNAQAHCNFPSSTGGGAAAPGDGSAGVFDLGECSIIPEPVLAGPRTASSVGSPASPVAARSECPPMSDRTCSENLFSFLTEAAKVERKERLRGNRAKKWGTGLQHDETVSLLPATTTSVIKV